MTVDPATAAATVSYANRDFCFCNPGCAERLAENPLAHLSDAPDPVCGMTVDVASAQWRATADGVGYVFCGEGWP